MHERIGRLRPVTINKRGGYSNLAIICMAKREGSLIALYTPGGEVSQAVIFMETVHDLNMSRPPAAVDDGRGLKCNEFADDVDQNQVESRISDPCLPVNPRHESRVMSLAKSRYNSRFRIPKQERSSITQHDRIAIIINATAVT